MDLKDLKELDKKEQDRVGNILKKHKSDSKVDINVFYKDFNLNGPYTSFNPHSSADLKPFQLSPFFKNVIVDIKPFQNEKTFEKHYGMDVERMFDLKEEGLFKFRLSNNYTSYNKLDNDYLDLILYDSPPVLDGINRAHGLLVNCDDNDINELYNLIGGNEFNLGNLLNLDLGISDPMVISAMDIMRGYEGIFRQDDDWAYKRLTVNNFRNLWACGYSEINNYLRRFLDRNSCRLDWAFVLSNVYSNFLSNPTLSSLNGTHMVNFKVKYWADDLSVQNLTKIFPDFNSSTNSDFNDDSIISPEVVKSMSETIGVNTVLDYDEWRDQDFKGAINALKSLEKSISRRREEDITDYVIVLQNELASASEIAKSLQEGKENNKNILNWCSICLSISGFFGGYLTGNLAALLAAASFVSIPMDISSGTGVTDWVLDKFNRLNKENHVLYFYDNFDKLKFKNNPPIFEVGKINEYSKFNDVLTRKYDYYEYLYKKIPSIKILIDVHVQNMIGDGFKVVSDNHEIAYKLNKMFEKISLESKLKLLLQHYFLYGVGYFIDEIDETNDIMDVNVINPHYVRQIKNNNVIENCVIKNKKIMALKNISVFNGCSLIEKSMPLFDAFYFDITKIENRPLLLHDELINNNEWLKNHEDDIEESIMRTKQSLEYCRQLNDVGQEGILLFQLGILYVRENELKKAIIYFESALDTISDCKSDKILKYCPLIEDAIEKYQEFI